MLNLALPYAETLDTTDPAKFTQEMRKRFGRDVKVERVIAAEGENAVTDYLGFNGSKGSCRQTVEVEFICRMAWPRAVAARRSI